MKRRLEVGVKNCVCVLLCGFSCPGEVKSIDICDMFFFVFFGFNDSTVHYSRDLIISYTEDFAVKKKTTVPPRSVHSWFYK